MTFDFYLPKAEQAQNINVTITQKVAVNTDIQKFLFKTPLIIEHEYWDEKKQRPTNIYLKKYKKLNTKLNEIKIGINEYIKERKLLKKNISHRALCEKIKKICIEKTTPYPKSSLLFFIQLYLDTKKDLISYSTYKRYMVFFKLIQKFEGFIMERLHVDTIDTKCIKNFILFGKEETYSENTIYRSVHFIRTILNFAERKGFRTAVRELEIRREKQHREIITLNQQEILEIKQTLLPEELHPARDWLIISCYTGQRVSDFMNFSTDQLSQVDGKICISFTQKKTKKKMILPLHPDVLNVIKKNQDSFPEKIQQQEYNRQIKKIARIAGLNQSINAKKRTGHRTINASLEKWEAISSHIGRRTFATMFYGKIPTPLLMEATGHTTEQMFLQYINTVDKNKIVCLSRHFNKIYMKEKKAYKINPRFEIRNPGSTSLPSFATTVILPPAYRSQK
jgi:site-specific recombinase XerD